MVECFKAYTCTLAVEKLLKGLTPRDKMYFNIVSINML